MADKVDTREFGREGPDIKFFYVKHSLDNAEEIWDRVKDRDVLLIEAIVPSQFEKDLYNSIFASVVESKDEEYKKRSGDMFSGFLAGTYAGVIVPRAMEKGKQIVFIDVTGETHNYKLSNQATEEGRMSMDAFAEGDPGGALRHYKNYIQQMAESSREREVIVLEEIEELMKKNEASWKDKKIAVIQGAAHTPTYHQYKKIHPQSQSSRDMPKERYTFLAGNKLVRSRAITPEKEISEIQYIRTFLSRTLAASGIYTYGDVINREDASEQAEKAVSLLSDDEVDSIWKSIMMLKVRPRLNGLGLDRGYEQDKLTYTLALTGISKDIAENWMSRSKESK